MSAHTHTVNEWKKCDEKFRFLSSDIENSCSLEHCGTQPQSTCFKMEGTEIIVPVVYEVHCYFGVQLLP